MMFFKIPDLLASYTWSEKFVSKLANKDYRHAYMKEGVRSWIARQVRILREQRGWSQEDLGHETNKPQSAISRIEDPDYGRLSLQTLFDLASAYDVGILVQFVTWDDWLSRMDDVSIEAMQKDSFDGEQLLNPFNQFSISHANTVLFNAMDVSFHPISGPLNDLVYMDENDADHFNVPERTISQAIVYKGAIGHG